MASFDANCVLRYLLQDIPEQAKLVEDVMRVSRRIDVDDVVLVEVVCVMEKVYRLPRRIIVDAIEQLMATGVIGCSRDILSAALPLFGKQSKLSFVDCYLAVRADQEETTPLFTFDRELAVQLPQAKLLPGMV